MTDLKHLEKSKKYFAEVVRMAMPKPALAMAEGPGEAAPEEAGITSYTGKSGLFTFVFSDEKLTDDPEIAKKVEEAKYYLKGFMSLVTGKLFSDNKDDVQKAFTIPPENVKEVATHLPLISSFSSEKMENKKSTSTVEFSTDFLKAVLGASIGGAPAAIASATSWLNNVGNEITAKAKSDLTNYKVTVFSGIIEVLGKGKIIDIEPQFCISGVEMSVSDIQASLTGCAKATNFKLNYTGTKFLAGLNIDALKDPAIKKSVDHLVTGELVTQIEESQNYFSA